MAKTTFSNWFRLRMPAKSTAIEFAQVYSNPNDNLRSLYASRDALYNLLWDLYTNEIYTRRADKVDRYINYRTEHGLYKHIRGIYNIVPRVVDFYAANVYPGVWVEPAVSIPDGVRRALPLNEDIPDELAAAIFQLVEWSNFSLQSKVLIRRVAALGNTLVEVADMVNEGKVSFNVLWANQVLDVQTDLMGNVKAYVLQYTALDENNIPYTYRKTVDEFNSIEYKDDLETQRTPNPYGFVPAVWFKFVDMGETFGVPAVRSSIRQINELNSVVTHIHDRGIHKALKAPRILWTDGIITGAFDTSTDENSELNESESSSDYDFNAAASEYDILKGQAGGKSDSIVTTMPLADALEYVNTMMTEIESLNPETAFWQQVREMTNVAGIAVLRVSGDVTERVLEVAGNFDSGVKRLLQMGISVAGFRFNENKAGWSLRTEHQKKFARFNLDSFKRDDLAFTIQPRLLIQPTESETMAAKNARAEYANKIKDKISDDEYFRLLGYSKEEITAIRTERSTIDVIPPADEQL